MIYDVVMREAADWGQIASMAGGQLFAYPFELATSATLLIEGQHVMQAAQDHSLRTWVSREAGGSPFARGAASYWHLNRRPGEIVTVLDTRLVPPPGLVISAEPGSYFCNVLNLTNGPNGFLISLTEST